MANPVTKQAVLEALRGIRDPELNRDIVSLGVAKDVTIDGTRVVIDIELTHGGSPLRESIQKQIAAALRDSDTGVTEFALRMSVRAGGGPAVAPPTAGPGGTNNPLPQVKAVIAVGAGKGGVGKSTIAVNLAVGLARLGRSVGLMDGDIYGPSTPTLLGIRGRAPEMAGGKIVPFFVHGVHAITIGALVEQEKPLIWRGPMAHGAFKQLLLDNTQWPELDYMIVDLPPGTGDVSLTLCQLVPLTGAVVVATPQQVALDDAVRAVRMFQQLQAPVLGMVENMSYFVTPSGEVADLFGRGGAETAAKRMGLPFLGSLALFPELRVNSDAGTPIANFEGDPLLATALEGIVSAVEREVEARRGTVKGGAAPQLTVS